MMGESFPPDAISRIDQRSAECGEYLDKMVKLYRGFQASEGDAAVRVQMSSELTRQVMAGENLVKSIGSLADTLVIAIARLAAKPL
jgi:hypothetical protein